MPTATDDSGPAAMSVSEKLAFLRSDCDRVGIKWHWRHKQSTLEGMIRDYVAAMPDKTETVSANTPAGESNLMEIAPPAEKRHIPQDVLDALDYCNGYHRGNTKRIREYIESIL